MDSMLSNIFGNNNTNNVSKSPMDVVQKMINQNPSLSKAWQEAQIMAQGKNEDEIMNMVNQLAKQKGIDINQVIKMFK